MAAVHEVASGLVIGSAACLALACLLWAVREAVEAHADRAREEVMVVAWAVDRRALAGRFVADQDAAQQ